MGLLPLCRTKPQGLQTWTEPNPNYIGSCTPFVTLSAYAKLLAHTENFKLYALNEQFVTVAIPKGNKP